MTGKFTWNKFKTECLTSGPTSNAKNDMKAYFTLVECEYDEQAAAAKFGMKGSVDIFIRMVGRGWEAAGKTYRQRRLNVG